MQLRAYCPADCAAIATLFQATVHSVNAKDYTAHQRMVWTNSIDLAAWNTSFLAHRTLLAEESGTLLGFADMDAAGYLDRLYVHKNYQGQGIASALLNQLEKEALQQGICHFKTHASITAKPFFAARGYVLQKENTVLRQGVALTNFIMEKTVATAEQGRKPLAQ